MKLQLTALILLFSTCPALAEIPYPDALETQQWSKRSVRHQPRGTGARQRRPLRVAVGSQRRALSARDQERRMGCPRGHFSRIRPCCGWTFPTKNGAVAAVARQAIAKPYPQPRCAAIIRFGDGAEVAGWQTIRAGGKVNEWLRQGDAGIMAVEGPATVSAGYRYNLAAVRGGVVQILGVPDFRQRRGTVLHQHLQSEGQSRRGKRLDRFAVRGEGSLLCDPRRRQGRRRRILCAVEKRSAAQNRIRQIAFQGGTPPLVIAAGMPDAGVKSARLDLRRAVATVNGADRANAGRPQRVSDRDRQGDLPRRDQGARTACGRARRQRRRQVAARKNAGRHGLRRDGIRVGRGVFRESRRRFRW